MESFSRPRARAFCGVHGSGRTGCARRQSAEAGHNPRTDRQGGKAAYRAGRFDDAVIAFKAAFRTNQDPKYLYNLGMSYRKKGDDHEAIAAFQEYLDESPGADDADKVTAALSFLRMRLEETQVELQVTSEPSGAALKITGEGKEVRAATPYTGWHLPGEYLLRLQATDHVSEERRLVLALGAGVEVDIVLARMVAKKPPEPPEEKAAEPPDEKVPEPPKEKVPLTKMPPPRPEPAPARSGSMVRTIAWSTAGLALLSGGLFYMIAEGKSDQLDSYDAERQDPGRTRSGAEQLGDSVELFGAAATGSRILAGAAAATGVPSR